MTEPKQQEEVINIPLEATLPALHVRVMGIETGQREIKEALKDIPQRTAELVAAKHPTREECAAQHKKSSEIPWMKILGTTVFVVITAIAGWLGIPVQWISLPSTPPPIAGAK